MQTSLVHGGSGGLADTVASRGKHGRFTCDSAVQLDEMQQRPCHQEVSSCTYFCDSDDGEDDEVAVCDSQGLLFTDYLSLSLSLVCVLSAAVARFHVEI
jgi:hypothetical protein